MTADLRLYDGASPADDITVSLGPGDTSATYARTLMNDGDETAPGVTLVLEALDGTTWKRQGMPILDEMWFSVRATGVDATGDPAFGPFESGSKRLGNSSRLVLPDIPAACGVELDIEVFGPATIGTAAIETHLIADWQRNSYPIAERIGQQGNGILPGWRDAATRRIVTGFVVTATGDDTPSDDEGLLDFDGERKASIESGYTLNQNDGAAAALGSGESYIAIRSVTASGVRTTTKGTKSATPTAPATPANEIKFAEITVDYQVGGTSVIDQSDVDQTFLIRGDYYLEDGGGLNVRVHAGSGIHTTDHVTFHGSVATLALTAAATNYVWRNPDGTWEDNVTAAIPQDGSELCWEVDCDGSSVTAIRDRRTYLTRPFDEFPIHLRIGTVAAAQTAPADYDVIPADCEIDRVRLEGGAIAGGAADAYILEVATAPEGEPTAGTWTTIYTSSGTQDLRPSIAFDATVLASESRFHEVRRCQQNTRIGAWIAAIPAGGTITNARVIVYVRRYR